MFPLITVGEVSAGEVQTWILVALAIASGIVALVALVRVVRGRRGRTDLIALSTAPQDEDEERDDDD
ncbi:MAG TPA: hypothetical protein GXZ30_15390 [Propionibacterium sp.]|nr:hypothetical protein [Propionibacterium sp.]